METSASLTHSSQNPHLSVKSKNCHRRMRDKSHMHSVALLDDLFLGLGYRGATLYFLHA